MMKFTLEMVNKAKNTKSVEELLAMAKDNGIELSLEEATDYFEQLNPPSGELDDDELDNVAGGGCRKQKKWGFANGQLVCVPKNNNVRMACRCVNHSKANYIGTIWFDEIQLNKKGSNEWGIVCSNCSDIFLTGTGDPRNKGVY